ncbi:MAG: nucleotidyltransferase domain-containing protein [Candidatus Muirbacterium halophilum]|jgi:predicted nucleotidyltransferase|nr:nucleotidyltransferase domain-containing protein [Candidatus Muirbacterium halophilum]MCK9474422.1 nucleotidyltransferase domain-containing protein [Candidatus Muirbacterium halophilum]
MDKIKAIEKAREYAKLVKEKFSGSEVFLFGSFVTGKYNENSDIDIAVILKNFYGDFLEQELNLYRLRRNIDNRIEPILLLDGNDPSGFLEEIKKNGVSL